MDILTIASNIAFVLSICLFIYGCFYPVEDNRTKRIGLFIFGSGFLLFCLAVSVAMYEYNQDVTEMEAKTGCEFLQADKNVAYMECAGGIITMFRMIE